jgi:hypothetical protein
MSHGFALEFAQNLGYFLLTAKYSAQTEVSTMTFTALA